MQEQQKAPLLRPLLYLYLHAAAPFVGPPAANPVFNYLEGHVCVDGVMLVCPPPFSVTACLAQVTPATLWKKTFFKNFDKTLRGLF